MKAKNKNSLCGGAVLFENPLYSVRIVPQNELVLANLVILGVDKKWA